MPARGRPPNPVSWAVTVSLAVAVFALVIALAIGGAYLAQYNNTQNQNAKERQQGLLVTEKICHTLNAIAALEPPPGNPSVNPSRAYEQRFHTVIDQLRPDLGCQHVHS